MTTKPKTIADLSINWVFTPHYIGIEETIEQINKLNPDLKDLKIKKYTYKFEYNKYEAGGLTFDIDARNFNPFPDFLEYVDFKFREQRKNIRGYDTELEPLTLDCFELISKNTFRIHVKK